MSERFLIFPMALFGKELIYTSEFNRWQLTAALSSRCINKEWLLFLMMRIWKGVRQGRAMPDAGSPLLYSRTGLLLGTHLSSWAFGWKAVGRGEVAPPAEVWNRHRGLPSRLDGVRSCNFFCKSFSMGLHGCRGPAVQGYVSRLAAGHNLEDTFPYRPLRSHPQLAEAHRWYFVNWLRDGMFSRDGMPIVGIETGRAGSPRSCSLND
ncbi:hypothetical protein N656DRAFT_608470 [Canariomyces notabilis]|uniref:Uncharacterized protein n=1 Tax=Canariomyces notabilis TaxID=2074819 RepID=A0AAN6TGB5_9PEZI|nr:hypothetical protein N656DRAFT_608470 [Canariomyces arenarius]